MFEAKDFLDLEGLCRGLDASESSVRRDLGCAGKRGGAEAGLRGALSRCPQPGTMSFDFTVESERSSDEKSRIARVTVSLIEDGQTVILDGGSTVAAVARQLAAKSHGASRSLHVITNSQPIAETLESSRSIGLTLTGGYLDSRRRVMLGPLCEQMLGLIRADVLIMGIGSVSEAGFSNNHTLVVGSEQKMIEIASRVIIVADHTKFGRGAMIPVAQLDVADTVVSDRGLAAEYVELLRSKDIDVLLA